MCLRILLLSLCLFRIVIAYSQEDEIHTDQPDQTIGAQVLDKKLGQVESSLYINHFTTLGTAVVSSNLVRLGLTKQIEARLLVEQGHNRDLYITEAAHATAPLALGVKVAVLGEKKIAPAVSIAASLQIPVTNFNDQPNLWSPSVILIAEKKVTDHLTIAANGGPRQAAFEKVWEWQSTCDVKYEIGQCCTVFGEYFGQFEHHAAPLHNIDGGILFALSKKLQLHLTGGSSIAHHPNNYFANTGVSFQINR